MTHNFLDPFTLAEVHDRRVRLIADWAPATSRRKERRRRWWPVRKRPAVTYDGDGVPWAEVRVFPESDPVVVDFRQDAVGSTADGSIHMTSKRWPSGSVKLRLYMKP